MSSQKDKLSEDTTPERNQQSSEQPEIDPRLIAAMPRTLEIPATVILERRMISRSFWSMPSWYLHAVATGNHLVAADTFSGSRGTPAGTSAQGDLFAWSGLHVTLYKDACERYWHALIGDKPLVYVICRDETDGAASDELTLQPLSVTVDYDEASAAAETDDPVFSRPITGELYRYMEQFVLTHYKPQAFKKRKRRNWSANGGSADKGIADSQDNEHDPIRKG